MASSRSTAAKCTPKARSASAPRSALNSPLPLRRAPHANPHPSSTLNPSEGTPSMPEAATVAPPNNEEVSIRLPEPRIAGPAHILIIDDESAIRDSLETLLTMEGFQV